jgi:uncharacterized membrane protein
MARLASVPLTQGWLGLWIALYVLVGVCWLRVVGLQIQLRRMAEACLKTGDPLPPLYFRYLRLWFILGWPAFTAVLAIFYLMVFKPDL